MDLFNFSLFQSAYSIQEEAFLNFQENAKFLNVERNQWQVYSILSCWPRTSMLIHYSDFTLISQVCMLVLGWWLLKKEAIDSQVAITFFKKSAS